MQVSLRFHFHRGECGGSIMFMVMNRDWDNEQPIVCEKGHELHLSDGQREKLRVPLSSLEPDVFDVLVLVGGQSLVRKPEVPMGVSECAGK